MEVDRAAWATFGSFKIQNTWAWRLPSALQAVPSLLQVLLVFCVPESPRYLVRNGREAEALRILAYYHAKGDEYGSPTAGYDESHRNTRRNNPLVRYEFEEIKAAMELENASEHESPCQLVSLSAKFVPSGSANHGWKSFLASSGNLKRVRIIIAIAFFTQWSGNGLATYYLNKVLSDIGITNPTTQVQPLPPRSRSALILYLTAACERYLGDLGPRMLTHDLCQCGAVRPPHLVHDFHVSHGTRLYRANNLLCKIHDQREYRRGARNDCIHLPLFCGI
jgi:hypothetical protein